MSFIEMTGVEPDDSMAQKCRRAKAGSDVRSPEVSWAEVAVAWVMAAGGLGVTFALCFVVSATGLLH
jgi:hypothetical protein